MSDEGGGASRSTDPAAGSSAATDVSLREFFAVQLGALDRFTTSELNALRRETQAASVSADKAIEVAKQEAAERLMAHNGLIDQMKQQATEFASRESLDDFKKTNDARITRTERFQYTITGGLIFIGFVGVANFVRLWGN